MPRRRNPTNAKLAKGKKIERRQTEEVLRENEERYRRLVELSPDAMAVHSEGKIVFINTAGARLIGATNPKQIIGKSIMDFLHPDYRKTVKERFREMREKGKGVPFIEEKFIRLNGTEVDVEVATTPFTNLGKPAMLAVARDITERKKMEDERLKVATDKQRIKELERFAKLAVGRELKMVELKRRIKELEKQLKK